MLSEPAGIALSSQGHWDVLHSLSGDSPCPTAHQHTATAGPGHRATPALCCWRGSYWCTGHGQAEPNSPWTKAQLQQAILRDSSLEWRENTQWASSQSQEFPRAQNTAKETKTSCRSLAYQTLRVKITEIIKNMTSGKAELTNTKT